MEMQSKYCAHEVWILLLVNVYGADTDFMCIELTEKFQCSQSDVPYFEEFPEEIKLVPRNFEML
jgi:hypothetical protein